METFDLPRYDEHVSLPIEIYASVPEWTKGTACKAVKSRVQIPPGAPKLNLDI